MNESSYPSSYPPSQPPRPQGMGCFAKGCLTLVVVAVLVVAMMIGVGYYVIKNSADYIGQQPVPVRTYPATDEQYNTVIAKLQPFGQALRDGHAATLTLTADDLNILIARSPQFAELRGKTYLSIVQNQLAAEISAPLNGEASPGTIYFHGRVVLDASYSADDFTFVLRRFEPLTGTSTGLLGKLAGDANFLRGFSRGLTTGFNRSFHDQVDRDPRTAALMRKVRTIILKDNEVVVTAAEGQPMLPDPAAAPAPVASPANSE